MSTIKKVCHNHWYLFSSLPPFETLSICWHCAIKYWQTVAKLGSHHIIIKAFQIFRSIKKYNFWILVFYCTFKISSINPSIELTYPLRDFIEFKYEVWFCFHFNFEDISVSTSVILEIDFPIKSQLTTHMYLTEYSLIVE